MDPSERLLDLATLLLSSRRPVPTGEIYEAFPDAYTGTPQARERKLSRDKEQLRELGLPLVFEADDEEEGFRIDRATFYLKDLSFTPEEQAALFAVGAAALAADFPLRVDLAHALTKLRAVQGDAQEAAAPIVVSQTARQTEVEATVTQAIVHHRRLVLQYPPESKERSFDPYVSSLRRGRFTFVGFCHLRKAIRTFHADRVTSCRFARDTSGPDFEVPPGFDPTPHLPAHSWQIRLHPPVDVHLAFPPALAEGGPKALGLEPGQPCPATNLDGLIAELLTLGEGIRITAPESARDRMRELLHDLQKRLAGTA